MSILKVGDIKHESFTGTTQLKLDSAGRLLVGTTTEGASGADQFTVANSGSGGMTFQMLLLALLSMLVIFNINTITIGLISERQHQQE